MASNDDQAARVVAALERDDVVIIPTDTVYGLAANPKSPVAMARLFELKRRPEGVPVAVLAASIEQASGLVRSSDFFDELANRHWPGALTIVAASARNLGFHLGDTANAEGVATIGVRVPDFPLLQECARMFGPVAATSANIHGSPTITDPTSLVSAFGNVVELIVDGGELEGLASTVVDVSGGHLDVLRQGVVQVD